MGKFVLSLDQGTTSTRAIIFDHSGNIVAKAQVEIKQYYPSSGWVEHDAEEIFCSAVTVIRDALKKAKLTASDILTMGITNQRETIVIWDRGTGAPLHNAVVWQCRRTALYMERLAQSDKEAFIYDKTGLLCDAYFSASKLKWLLDNVPNARTLASEGKLLAGTIDSYLLYRLSGGKVHATDRTNASRTMLYNIHANEWDDELCEVFTVPHNILPPVYPSGHDYGVTDEKLFGAAIRIGALVGDQQGALFGQKCWNKGDSKNTYGTGCFLLMNTGSEAIKSQRGLITTLAATTDGEVQYALEGSVFIGGAAIQWLRDEMGIIKTAGESEALATSVEDCGGVYFVPAFVGLGAPHWDSDARGLITGITRGTNRAHITRATLEAIAYQVFDVLHAMERDLSVKVGKLCVDGGASANNFLMQFQADIINATVARPTVIETTALGACYLAGLTHGYWTGKDDILSHGGEFTLFAPTLPEAKRRQLILGWGEAILRAKAK